MYIKNISRVVILIIIAVAGLVTIQLYWINSAIDIKEEHFAQDVNEALNRVVYYLQKKNTAAKISKRLNLQRQSSRSVLLDTNLLGNKSQFDNLFRLNVYEETVSDSGGVIIKKTRNKTYSNDSLFSKDFGFGLSINKTDKFSSAEVDSVNNTLSWFVQQKNLVNDIFDELVSVNIYSDASWKIDTLELDSILNMELREQGVKAKYEFGILNAYKNAFLFAPKLSERENILNSRFQINLSPDNIYIQPKYLSVYFPDEKNYILKTMWLILLGSALLLIIIVFSFSYTLITIYRQRKLSEVKNDFINNMTHELKTPISTISLACDVMSDEVVQKDSVKIDRYVKMIQTENKRLSTLVENVLQSALIEQGNFNLNIEKIDVHSIIQQSVKNISLQVEKRQGEIVLELNSPKFIVNADRMHLTNIFYNLIDNALKYTEQKPLIKIASQLQGGVLTISISDNGIGISKENQKRVFEKLYRVSTGNVHNVKGFGLGLNYVKAVVDKHGASIRLKSESGVGSTFSIVFPAELLS